MKLIVAIGVKLVCAVIGLGLSVVSFAATWPERAVQIVVSSGAGGTADIFARLIGERLAAATGQPFVIDNKPGAGGMLGAERVARAPADGYTLLLSGSPTHAIGPHLYKLSFDPMRDIPPVAMLAVAPNLLTVNPALPVKSVSEFVEFAKRSPKKPFYSSAGEGTTGHLAAEWMKQLAGIEATHVPFKSGPESVTAVIAGTVDFNFFTVPATLPQVRAGRLRALAITSQDRSPLAPEVPTVIESGYSEFVVLGWFALFAPRGVPPEITRRIELEIKNILEQPDVRDKFARLGAEPKFLDAAATTEFAEKDSLKWRDIIRKSGMKVER